MATIDPASAVPADPSPQEVTQSDGSKVLLRLRGDEYFSWHETTDGYAVAKDADGFWKFARPVAGRAAFQALSAARVGVVDPERIGLKKRELPEAAVLRARLQKRRDAIHGSSQVGSLLPGNKSSGIPSTSPAPSSDGSATDSPPPEAPPHPVPVQGVKTIKNLVILACASNHWDDLNNTVLPAYGRVAIDEYDKLFNEVGHSTDGARGSVRDYYKEVSYNKLSINSTVTVWVKLPQVESYYHDNQGTLAADAVAAAEAAGVDFSLFDSDGDGWIDCLDIIHSGYGEEAGGGLHPDWIWSVKGSMPSVVTMDGMKMYTYHTEPALRSSSGTGISRIGTICHETGHFFGLPDLYDYSGTIDGLGKWCLMSGGSWNGASGTRPGHFSAWCKVFLGFAKTIPIHSKIGLSLPCVETNPVVGMMRDGMNNDEYFLIENRSTVGFDDSGAVYSGMLIYHVDQRSANNDLGTKPHPAVKIEEANANNNLTEAGDAWTSTNGLPGGWRDQTGSLSSNAMLYQTGVLFDRSDSSPSYSYNRLNNFSAAGSTMTCNVQSLKTDVPSQVALDSRPFTVTWAACSEATKYEVQEGSPANLTSFFDGAENADDLHDNWYVAGKTLRSTEGAKTGTYSYGLLRANYGGVQSLILRKPFKVTASTVVSFDLMSHVSAGYGYLKCELSNDQGDTWKTLGSYSGIVDPWSLRSYNFSAISAAGIAAGDECILRFIMDSEYGSGTASFPNRSYALDDISITGIEIPGYSAWTTLDNNVTATSFSVVGKSPNTYAYRVQAYANGAWQGYGSVGETTVGANHPPTWTFNPVNSADANIGTAYAGAAGSLVSDLDANDTLTFSKVSGPAWLNVAPSGTLSGTPLPNDAGSNTFALRVTDLAGAFAETQVNIFVRPPASALSADLMAYLPFDDDFLDYSGRGNHPTQSGTNARATANIGANGYVLNNTGYLGFGMNPDLHFQDTPEGNAASFSVSFWAKLPTGSYTGSPPFISNKDWAADANTGWGLSTGPGSPSSSGYFQMNFKESNANSRDYDWTTAPGSTWHHFLVVFQRSGTRTCITYIDGTQADSRTMFATGVNIDGAGLPLNLGQDGTGTGMRGSWSGAQMDDFAFWRRALSATDATAIRNAGLNGYGVAYAEAKPVITSLSTGSSLPMGGNLSLTVTAQSATSATYQWWLDGSPIVGATSATYSQSGITAADLGNYYVIVTNAYGATTSSEIQIHNGVPAATDLTVIRRAGMTLKIPLSDLAARWSDPDSDPVKLIRIDSVTSLGVDLVRLNVTTGGDGSFVISDTAYLGYSSSQVLSDQFTYTITDGMGGSTEGRVIIQSSADPLSGQTTGVVLTSDGSATVSFIGIPGYPYSIQRSTNLVNWLTIHNQITPPGGRFTFVDSFGDLGGTPPPSAFYRMTWTP